jgi:putative flippase GtrA
MALRETGRIITKQQVAALVATVVDFSVMTLAVRALGLAAATATVLGALSGCCVGFHASRRCVFGQRGGDISRQAFRYVTVSLVGLCANTLGEELVVRAGANYLLGRAFVSTLVALAWSFPMQRRFVFAPIETWRPRRTWAIPIASALVLLAGCAPALTVRTRIDASAPLRYSTFALAVVEHAPDGYRRAPLLRDVVAAIDEVAPTALGARGYRIAPIEAADLIVRIAVGERGMREEAGQQTDSTGSQVTLDDPDGPFNYLERAIELEAVDAHTRRPVWRGLATSIATRGWVERDEIRSAVDALAARLPVAQR